MLMQISLVNKEFPSDLVLKICKFSHDAYKQFLKAGKTGMSMNSSLLIHLQNLDAASSIFLLLTPPEWFGPEKHD